MIAKLTTLVAAFIAMSLLRASSARAAEPTVTDCLSANESSIAMHNSGQFLAERAQLLTCANRACPAEVSKECLRRVEEVNAALPTLVFRVTDGAGHDLSAVTVTVGDAVLARRLDGTALAVDPGEHTFTFQSPGQPLLSKQLIIRQGDKGRKEQVMLGTPPKAELLRPGQGEKPPAEPFSTQKKIAVAVAGVGAVGVLVGAVFGVSSVSKHGDAEKYCSGAACRDQRGFDAANSARSAGNVSTVAFIVGAACLAGGAALWFTAKPHPNETRVGLGLGSVQVAGSF